jgi:uncharacterized coiled-coil DUF342 family protein
MATKTSWQQLQDEVINRVGSMRDSRATLAAIEVLCELFDEERRKVGEFLPKLQPLLDQLRRNQERLEAVIAETEAKIRRVEDEKRFARESAEQAASTAALLKKPLRPGQCCERDFDGDGNCDRHPAGVKR